MSAWNGSTAYTVGEYVTNGGNTYLCTSAGTSAASGGPTGTSSGITDGTVTWAYYDNIAETDSQAFVVYVPPTSDSTVESCLRLGAGPSLQSTTDELTTYKDIVGASSSLSGLSSSTYSPSSGIALLTPGAINLVAAGGVNTTSGSYTNSTIGSSYSVTQDPNSKEIVSASYTNNNLGLWTTASFNQEACTMAVNTIPLQAAINLGVSYSLSGPFSFANSCGLLFSSTIGYSVSAQLAHTVDIGWRTLTSYAPDSSNNEYYTAKQTASTAAGFSWTVPRAGPTYLAFDALQQTWCALVNKAALATNIVAAAYAVTGAGIAYGGSPDDVQKWLKGAEPIAIVCTTLNAILAAMGLWLGGKVDALAVDPFANPGATSFVIGNGHAELHTGLNDRAPALNLDGPTKQISLTTDNPATGPGLRLDGTNGVFLGKATKGMIEMTDQSLILSFGNAVSITLGAAGITLTAPGHSVEVANDRVAVAGNNVTLDGITAAIYGLNLQIQANSQGLAQEVQARADAIQAEAVLRLAAAQVAAAARTAALLVQQQLNALVTPAPEPPLDPLTAAQIYGW